VFLTSKLILSDTKQKGLHFPSRHYQDLDLYRNSLDGRDLIIKKCQLGDISKDEENITLRRLASKTTTGAWLRKAFQQGKDVVTLDEIGDLIAEEDKQKKLKNIAEAEASKKAKVPTGEDTGATLQSGEEVTDGADSDNKRLVVRSVSRVISLLPPR
jgi:hypothetical protein